MNNVSGVCGIDPSLTGSAVCCWDPDGTGPSFQEKYGSQPAKTLAGRIDRFETLARSVCRSLQGTTLVVIEGYSHGSKGSSVLSIAEYGGILRAAMLKITPHVIEVSPSALKKFATGKGNSPKDVLMAHVAKRWGVLFSSNDEADAYVLARIGLCLAGFGQPETEWQREVIEKIKSSHPQIGSNDHERTDRRIHGACQT